MKHLWLLVFLFLGTSAQGQYDTAQVDHLMERVYSMQVVEDSFYDAGLFRSKRLWQDNLMEDNSFYYTASILNILRGLTPDFSKEAQSNYQHLFDNATTVAHRYANRKGEASYNFWQTRPDTPHPNGKPKHQKEKYGLPDDLDDSSVIALILDDDSVSRAVRDKMVTYAKVNNHKPIKSALKEHRETKAYRTWFADKWAQDVDLVTNCNILQFVFENDFRLNQFDSAAIALIRSSIENDLHLTNSARLSPWYGRPSLILYHVSRLIEMDAYPEINGLKEKVIADISSMLNDVENEYERLLLYISLNKLDQNPEVTIDEVQLVQDTKNFYFFYATSQNLPFSSFRLWVINTFNLVPSMYWKSEAFNLTVLVEFLVETGYSFDEATLGKF